MLIATNEANVESSHLLIKIANFQSAQMKEKDKRVKLMSEILNGMKVLKLYAWEESFTRIISGIRKEELTLLRTAGFTNAFSTLFWQIAPFMVSVSLFIIFIITCVLNTRSGVIQFACIQTCSPPLQRYTSIGISTIIWF